MKNSKQWQVVLLPSQDVVARSYTLREAVAWSRTYNRVFLGQPQSAVVARPRDELAVYQPRKAG